MWPMWSADGHRLYYVSDRIDSGNKNGAQNIWTATPGRSDFRRLSNFTDGRVLWPSISYDGREVVFEHNFSIWKLDTESGKASEVAITRRGASAGPGIERLRLTDQIGEVQLSPDGKKVAFIVRGEVFAASVADGGDAVRVSNSPAEEYQVAWAPDSRRLRLGLRFDRCEYERSGRLRITEVIALSPAAITGSIKPGDYLIGVGFSDNARRRTSEEQFVPNELKAYSLVQVEFNAGVQWVLNIPLPKGL